MNDVSIKPRPLVAALPFARAITAGKLDAHDPMAWELGGLSIK